MMRKPMSLTVKMLFDAFKKELDEYLIIVSNDFSYAKYWHALEAVSIFGELSALDVELACELSLEYGESLASMCKYITY